jgi:hypothetical protein
MLILLRGLVPYRRLGYEESLFYAEQQSFVFLKLAHVFEPAVPIEQLVTEVGLAAEIRDDPTQPAPGQSWLDQASGDWIISLNVTRGPAERAFVIAHEVKQIIDDGCLTANGIVGPQTWYRLFPDQPLRSYPHPGYLPPRRLHDLRHLAATLALTAGAEMKAVSEMLRHKTLAITADTYTWWCPRWPGRQLRQPPRSFRAGLGRRGPAVQLAPR